MELTDGFKEGLSDLQHSKSTKLVKESFTKQMCMMCFSLGETNLHIYFLYIRPTRSFETTIFKKRKRRKKNSKRNWNPSALLVGM